MYDVVKERGQTESDMKRVNHKGEAGIGSRSLAVLSRLKTVKLAQLLHSAWLLSIKVVEAVRPEPLVENCANAMRTSSA